jgi:hypothetical protein
MRPTVSLDQWEHFTLWTEDAELLKEPVLLQAGTHRYNFRLRSVTDSGAPAERCAYGQVVGPLTDRGHLLHHWLGSKTVRNGERTRQ